MVFFYSFHLFGLRFVFFPFLCASFIFLSFRFICLFVSDEVPGDEADDVMMEIIYREVEGSTDSSFLETGDEQVRVHLTDLTRYLDELIYFKLRQIMDHVSRPNI